MALRFWRNRHFADSPLRQEINRDLERGPWCYLLWGVPAVLAFATSAAYGRSALSTTQAGIFWTISVAWVGIGCFINGQYCGRVHCLVDGILFPALSIVGVLIILQIISISWSDFWITFLVILVASFVFEGIRGKYLQGDKPVS
jgi:hypothetical protein